jgi:hypothetical protein
VKFGAQRGPDATWLGYDASPAAVKTACAYSLPEAAADDRYGAPQMADLDSERT